MRFERFQVWRVVVPCRREVLSAPEAAGGYAANLTWPDAPIHLVEATTETGLVCVGESCRGETSEVVERTLRGLLGVDVATFHPATRHLAPHDRGGLPVPFPLYSYETVGAELSYMLLESLWHDAMGKAAGVPAHALMGGAVRGRVAAGFWANRPNAATLARLIAEARALGLSDIKLKSDARGDTVRALREIAAEVPPDFRVLIDPMCAWRTFRESRGLFARLAESGLDVSVEDPFPHEATAEWRAAAATGIPLIFHARSLASLRIGLSADVAVAYNCGGVVEHDFLRIAAAAEFAGKDCWHGSSIELGVLQALHLHGAACARNCVLPSDLCGEWVREHTLVTPRMRFEAGGACVPTSPGLGVALDHAAVESFAVGSFGVDR